MFRAVKIIEFYIAHSRVAMRALNADSRAERVDDVWTHLLRGHKDEFSLRELHRNLSRTRFPRIEDVIDAVEPLEERGYVIPLPAPERTRAGRPQSPRYRVNPRAKEARETIGEASSNSVGSAESRKPVSSEGDDRHE